MLRVVCAAIFFVAVSGASENSALISTFTLLGAPNKKGFFDIPLTESEAKEKGWVQPEETKAEELFTTYCQDGDFRLCPIFDQKGTIAGIRISVNKKVDDLKIEGMDFVQKGYIEQTLFGTPVYTNDIWFVNQETLKSGGRVWNNETTEGLWLHTGKELFEVPRFQSGMEDQTSFVKQNCFPKMGQHYFWKAHEDLKQEDFLPWFVLYDVTPNQEGEYPLIGLGLIYFGEAANAVSGEDNRKPVMEKVPKDAIYSIAPNVPDWVGEYSDTYGTMSVHLYFRSQPWDIKCGAFQTVKNVVNGFWTSRFG